MEHELLLDYEFAPARQGFVVRALLKLRGVAPAVATRAPLNIAVVLDRSGSMGGEKLAAARDATAFLVRRLAPDDVVSVVAYDGDVVTVVPPSTGDGHATIPRAIAGIEEGGSTNLSGGWLRGRELVAGSAALVPGSTMRRVLLLTDGQANVGITQPQLLTDLCGGARALGVTTTTIGFGADYDEELLRAMADAGGGNAYYIEHADQAAGVFEEEIEGLLSLAAQNVAVELTTPTSNVVELVAVHNGYPSHAIAGGLRLELGDLYAREPRTLLVEFFVAGAADVGHSAIATITVHAHVLTATGGVERVAVTLPVHATLDAQGHAEPEVRRELLLLETARARDEAVRRQRDGDHDGASAVLRQAVRVMACAPPELQASLQEQVHDLEAMVLRIDERAFGAQEEKYMAQRAYNARRGKMAYEEKLSRRSRPPA